MRPALVVLAAGVGSRYGGLKQLDPVGPGGAALMDYTMYDAARAGFGRVVLVIRRETEAEVRAHFDGRAAQQIEINYAFQDIDDLPEGAILPAGRYKPWGTGQAVLAAAPFIDGPFVVANADDFYGRRAIEALGSFLEESNGSDPPEWAMVGYRLDETLPPSGAVSRALCMRDEDGTLAGLEEVVAIERVGDAACWKDEHGETRIERLDRLVSMNLWGFTAKLVPYLERGFRSFLADGPGPAEEYYLPVAVGDAVAEGRARVRVLDEGGRWCGMTSPEDRESTARVLRELVDQGEYPEHPWV